MKRTPDKRSLWTWLPAMLVIAGSVVTAAGISLIPAAGAATTAPITVEGNVGSVAAVSPTCTGTAIQFAAGALTSNGNFASTSGTCAMAISTNHPAGVALEVSNNRAGWVAGDPAFCRIDGGADCTQADQNLGNATAGAALADGEFGVALTSTDGTAVATANATAAEGGAWYPIDSAISMCESVGTTDATCNFRFGANPKNPQMSGNYEAEVLFETQLL